MSADFAHIVFVARSSGGVKADWQPRLQRSIEHTKKRYEQDYGRVQCSFEFLTFSHRSNLPLPSSGHVVRFLRDAIEKAKCAEGRLLVVMNGWDGLTTNFGSLNAIFAADASRITFRVFTDMPRRFKEVNVAQALHIFLGEIQIDPSLAPEENKCNIGPDLRAELEDAEQLLEEHTAEFYLMFLAIYARKSGLSTEKAQLHRQSGHRNFDPAMEEDKYTCPEPGCGRTFPKQALLHAHQRMHDPAEKRECPYCQGIFARADTLTRHLRTCQSRPDTIKAQAPPRKNPFAPRGSREIQVPEGLPVPSDNAPPTYMELEPDQIKELPRIQTDPVVIATHPALKDAGCDIIYRGELCYRYPGCDKFHRYAAPNKLRRHYASAHDHVYPDFAKNVPASAQRVHMEGIQWLTKCALGDKENAGEQAYPLIQ